MKRSLKHGVLFLIALIVIVGISGGAKNTPSHRASAQVGSSKVNGYAWSDTIGWISFSDTNSTVSMAADGSLSGYAWSENIGWVSFQSADVANCPSGTCAPKVNTSTGAITGWARAIAGCQVFLLH